MKRGLETDQIPRQYPKLPVRECVPSRFGAHHNDTNPMPASEADLIAYRYPKLPVCEYVKRRIVSPGNKRTISTDQISRQYPKLPVRDECFIRHE